MTNVYSFIFAGGTLGHFPGGGTLGHRGDVTGCIPKASHGIFFAYVPDVPMSRFS